MHIACTRREIVDQSIGGFIVVATSCSLAKALSLLSAYARTDPRHAEELTAELI